ncbi:MAG: glycosyltransferase family 4 protein [Gammaproteobacteria bacterium]|nr:glycosyltransferase family 4 protein [Gammaproteobacteria bacterium]
MCWEGENEPLFRVQIIQPGGWQNHTRNASFAEVVRAHLNIEHYDLVIGFNKMPYLDMYYAADVCYQSRVQDKRGILYRLLPRYRQLLRLEKSVFGRGNKTEIILISPLQQQEFTHYYQTEAARFHLLPPGIARDRIAPENALEIREQVRNAYKLTADDRLLLLVGSGFKTKGLDRAIRGLACLPDALKAHTQLFVIGQDDATLFKRLAVRLNIAKQVHFFGGRDNVRDFLLAADLLLHPAYHENTGTILLEAVVSGLPVLTVDTCGYSHYVSEANVGVVLRSPFQQDEFNTTLQKMLLSSNRPQWRLNGLTFAKTADIYGLPEKAVDLIERIGQKRVFA